MRKPIGVFVGVIAVCIIGGMIATGQWASILPANNNAVVGPWQEMALNSGYNKNVSTNVIGSWQDVGLNGGYDPRLVGSWQEVSVNGGRDPNAAQISFDARIHQLYANPIGNHHNPNTYLWHLPDRRHIVVMNLDTQVVVHVYSFRVNNHRLQLTEGSNTYLYKRIPDLYIQLRW